jgi:hypothetical protein
LTRCSTLTHNIIPMVFRYMVRFKQRLLSHCWPYDLRSGRVDGRERTGSYVTSLAVAKTTGSRLKYQCGYFIAAPSTYQVSWRSVQHSNNIMVITATILEAAVLVFYRWEGFTNCRCDVLICQDIHIKFHKDWFSLLRHYATSRKVAESCPDEMDFFQLTHSSSHTMAQGSTQPLTKMCTRNLPGGKGQPTPEAYLGYGRQGTCHGRHWQVAFGSFWYQYFTIDTFLMILTYINIY